MSLDTLAEQFRDELGERVLATDIAHDQLTVTVDAGALAQVARFCKLDLGMTFFDFLGGIDEREEGFSVVVRVYNHIKREAALLKATVPGGRDEPRIGTLTDVYAGANWHERETYDMFGIVFDGHPGLLPRILTVENFEGWPLRKDFKLASRVVKPWPGAKEPGGDAEDADGATAAPAAVPGADPGDRAAAAKAKAERAKAKAAEARKRKAEQKAREQAGEEGTPAVTAEESGTDGSVDDAEPGSPREAAQAAAGRSTAEHTPDPTTPEGASKIADTAVAKDAAAGTSVGDELATAEQPDSAEPKRDAEREAEHAEGADDSQEGDEQ